MCSAQKELLFEFKEKCPGEDLHRVTEHPAGSMRSFLSKWFPRGHRMFI
jgi:hypothetical protein